MYTQIFLVTSVRGRVLAPRIAAIASLSFFGAKMPFPAFFMAIAIFFAAQPFGTAISGGRFSAFPFGVLWPVGGTSE